MVFCILSMIIFGVLSIFSVSARKEAKEAFRCAFRLVTLRPCDTEYDQRKKTQIVSKIQPHFPKTARFIYKRFTLISIILIIIMFTSAVYTGIAIYNLSVHGTCDPSDPEGQCFFNPSEPVCSSDDVPEGVICYDPECTNLSHKILNGDQNANT